MFIAQDLRSVSPVEYDHQSALTSASYAVTAYDRKATRKDTQAFPGFAAGTLIATIKGLVPVQNLKAGDRVLTRDRGFQPIKWVGSRAVALHDMAHDTADLPVLIRAHALGSGHPQRDIFVSPTHRILSTKPEHLEGTREIEVLVEARALVGQPGIMQIKPHSLTYSHLLFDEHEVILSENIWSESFYLSRVAFEAMLRAGHKEVMILFPKTASTPNINPQIMARQCLLIQSLRDLKQHCLSA